MATMQNIIDRALVIAQDVGGIRNAPASNPGQALAQLNDVLKAAKRIRPDLWFGQYGTPYADIAGGGTFPLPPEYEAGAVKALVAWFDLQENEYSEDSRAALMLGTSQKDFTG